MKKISIALLALCIFCINALAEKNGVEQTIFAFGGDINQKFVQYVVDLTGKQNPRICYVPTASADNEDNIKYWSFICKKLSLESFVLKVWVSSNKSNATFEETLLGMDAIVVGGGNTLNMLGIWKAQGIDEIIQKALAKGIILAGGSAGSICSFQNGISDSRPVDLSVVNGLSFLPYSNCPHFSDNQRKELYFKLMKSGRINPGYAMDNLAGVLFKGGRFVEAVAINEINNSYYVSLENGTVQSQLLESKILIDKDALPVTAYTRIDVNKTIGDFDEINDQSSPLNAFVSMKYIFANGKNSQYRDIACRFIKDRLSDTESDIEVDETHRNMFLNTSVDRVLIYQDSVAGVINKVSPDFYGLWFFSNENGKWMSAGEDIGGDTVLEAEITFREKAERNLQRYRD